MFTQTLILLEKLTEKQPSQVLLSIPGDLVSAAQMVQNEFRGRGGQHAYNTIMLHTQPSIPSSLKFKWAAPEMVEGALYDDKDGASPPSVYLDKPPQPAMHMLKGRTAFEPCL